MSSQLGHPLPVVSWEEDRTDRRRWTRNEYGRMLHACHLDESAPYELIDGYIFVQSAQPRRHALSCWRAQHLTSGIFGHQYVQFRGPVATDNLNGPKPDIVVLRHPVDSYMAGDPGPEDLLLVIEISATSLQVDRTVKAAVYARAGIADYWVLDVNGRVLYIYRSPGSGGYAEVMTLTAEDSVSPLAAPEQSILVADLLPPMEA